VSWTLGRHITLVLAIANCQTHFAWIAWPVAPQRTWEGYIQVAANGFILCAKTRVSCCMAHPSPLVMHWYCLEVATGTNLTTNTAYFHDCPKLSKSAQISCRFARNYLSRIVHLSCSTFCADYLFHFAHESAVHKFAEIAWCMFGSNKLFVNWLLPVVLNLLHLERIIWFQAMLMLAHQTFSLPFS